MTGFYDIHCHLIPGVDDGAETIEETIRMMQISYDQGVRHIIATPHFRERMFETAQEKIEKQFMLVKEAAKNVGCGMNIYLGCEFHVNMSMTEILNARERPTLAGSNYVLSEFSSTAEYFFIKERIYDLISNGYAPIIAHAERYESLCTHMERIDELVNIGAYIQVNAGSVMGENGRAAKRFCKNMIKLDLLHYIGTDSHDSSIRAPGMGACAAYLERKMGVDYVKRILIDNPFRIVEQTI